jgi:hypothetical protein
VRGNWRIFEGRCQIFSANFVAKFLTQGGLDLIHEIFEVLHLLENIVGVYCVDVAELIEGASHLITGGNLLLYAFYLDVLRFPYFTGNEEAQ